MSSNPKSNQQELSKRLEELEQLLTAIKKRKAVRFNRFSPSVDDTGSSEGRFRFDNPLVSKTLATQLSKHPLHSARYGSCLECGRKIKPSRLDTYSGVTFCFECTQK